MIPAAILHELLQRAAEERIGLYVRATDAQYLARQLYAIQDDAKREVMICISSAPDALLLTRRSVELS